MLVHCQHRLALRKDNSFSSLESIVRVVFSRFWRQRKDSLGGVRSQIDALIGLGGLAEELRG